MADHQVSDPDFSFIKNFSGLYVNDDEDFNFHNSINSILPPQFVNAAENGEAIMIDDADDDNKQRKRKAIDLSTCSSSSPDPKLNRRGRRGKKEEEEKEGEVIHVRAKRGQATDSHSLAERVRRGKINERLRCLQDIVPGCYKTMGMAVMLDEIINYVQSLQNQVEFLSMKLTAASSFYDINADTDAMEAMQRANAFEAIKAENVANEGLPSAQLGYYYPHEDY